MSRTEKLKQVMLDSTRTIGERNAAYHLLSQIQANEARRTTPLMARSFDMYL